MTKEEFVDLVGKDVVVDYPFGKELQRWSMKTSPSSMESSGTTGYH